MVVGRGVGHERVPVGAVASALGASLIPGSANPVAPGGLPVELGALGAWLGCPVVAEAVQLAGELVRRQAAVVLGLEVRL